MTNKEKNGTILLLLLIIILIGRCGKSTNNTHVKKGPSYDAIYDQQGEDLKRDLNKSEYDGIVIYDDNCDTILEIIK